MRDNNGELLNFLKGKLGSLLNKNMALILTGSRALGLEDESSDYDCYLIYDEKDRKKVRSKYLSGGWAVKEGGVWTNLENEKKEQVTLMTKSYEEVIEERESTLQYVFINSVILVDSSGKFKSALGKMRKNIDLEGELRKTYLSFMMDLSLLRGMLRKSYGKPVSFFKKGDVVRSLMKLSILLDDKPYPYEKILYYEFSKTKNFKKINEFIEKIKRVENVDKANELRKEIVDFVNGLMPSEEYVGKNWWRLR